MKKATVLLTLNGLEIGGAETHVVALAVNLNRLGYRVIVASNGGCYEEEIMRAGINHYRVPLHRATPYYLGRSLYMLLNIVRRERVELIHAHARIPAFVCDIVHRLTGIPFLTTAHAIFTSPLHLRYLSRWGEKTIAVSTDIKKHLITRFRLAPERIVVIPNGIDMTRFNPDIPADDLAQELAIAPDNTVITSISRLDEKLAPVVVRLIEVVLALRSRYPGLILLVVGDGEQREMVREAVAAANRAAGVFFCRWLGRRTDVNRIMKLSDLVVGVSRVALEAMACQRSVLLAGGEGYGGLLTPDLFPLLQEDNFTARQLGRKVNSRALMADLQLFLTEPLPEREKRCRHLRELVMRHYSSERMAEETSRIYEEMLRSGE